MASFAFVKPLSTVLVTEGWGHERSGRLHGGLDMRAPVGTPVFAVRDGNVIFGGQYADGSGGAVELDHGDGVITRYLHLSKVSVDKGELVIGGAQVGESGFAKSPHLHFDTWVTKDVLADYIAKYGDPKGEKSTKSWRGTTYYKIPSEPLIPDASYQDDVVDKATSFGVKLYTAGPMILVLAFVIGAWWFLKGRAA